MLFQNNHAASSTVCELPLKNRVLNFHRNSCMFEQSSHFSFDTLNLCFIALHSSKESVESMKWPFFVPQAPSTPFIKPFARLMSL